MKIRLARHGSVPRLANLFDYFDCVVASVYCVAMDMLDKSERRIYCGDPAMKAEIKRNIYVR